MYLQLSNSDINTIYASNNYSDGYIHVQIFTVLKMEMFMRYFLIKVTQPEQIKM